MVDGQGLDSLWGLSLTSAKLGSPCCAMTGPPRTAEGLLTGPTLSIRDGVRASTDYAVQVWRCEWGPQARETKTQRPPWILRGHPQPPALLSKSISTHTECKLVLPLGKSD